MSQHAKQTSSLKEPASASDQIQNTIYTPLNAQDHQIRLLRLLPGSDDQVIKCKCVIHSPKGSGSYEAVSYVWGSPTPTESIYLNGYEASITLNLWTLLKHFRKLKEGQLLWIDALCINQDDASEKNQQVSLMADIYRQCSECLVWLGNDTSVNHASQAFQLLRDLADGGEENTVFTSQAMLALKDVMACPWWSRIWVVQELLLPPRSLLFLGDQTIDWITVREAAEFCIGHIRHGRNGFRRLGFNGEIQYNFTTPCQCLTQLPRSGYREHIEFVVRKIKSLMMLQTRIHVRLPNIGFLELFCVLRDRCASDPRDHIFALLSLITKPSEGRIIQPEYSSDMVTVYVQSASKIIETNKTLRLLMLRPMFQYADPRLPSWVPGWRQAPRPGDYGRVFLDRPCHCSWFQAGRSELSVNLLPSNLLALRGRCYDSISVVGDLWSDACPVIEQWASIAGLPEAWACEAPILQNRGETEEDRDAVADELEQIEYFLERCIQRIQESLPYSATDGLKDMGF